MKTYDGRDITVDKYEMVTRAFANCTMILENAITAPEEYIDENYGTDENMCKVAEMYFNLGMKILKEVPDKTFGKLICKKRLEQEMAQNYRT